MDQKSSLRTFEDGYCVTVFGGPALRLAGQAIHISPLQAAFLGILAGHGDLGVSRGRILALLWEEGTDTTLRHRLNQLVYSLGARIEGEVLVRRTGHFYKLDPRVVRSDWDDFAAAITHHDVQLAARLVSRGFLSALAMFRTHDLDLWVRERDESLRGQVQTLLGQRWSDAVLAGDWRQAESTALTLLQFTPQDEAALRHLMRTRAIMGDPEGSRTAYHAFEGLRRVSEPTWHPALETVTLLEQLEELNATGFSTPTIHVTSCDEPPLIGRIREVEELTAALRGPSDLLANVIVVSGEPGIGKTRVIRESLARVVMHGHRVLSSSCSEFEASIPIGAMLRALSPSWLSEEVRALPAPWGPVMMALLPEFAPEIHQPSAFTGAPEEIQRVTCEALLHLLHNLARTRPLAVFFDDFNWIDPTSLTVLQYVVERWPGGQITLIVALCSDAVDEPDSPGRWLAGLRGRHPIVSEFQIGPLHNDAVEVLMASILDHSTHEGGPSGATDARIKRMVAVSDGNPMLAMEYARWERHFGGIGPVESARPPVPITLRTFLLRRLGALPPESHSLLHLLAVSDRPLPTSVLEPAAPLPPMAFASGLDAAIAQGLLRLSARGLEFRHGLLRETVRAQMSPAASLAAHRQVASAMISLSDPSLEIDIALHLLKAGEGRQAVPFVARSARAAIQSGGWDEARSLLKAALCADVPAEKKGTLAALLGKIHLLYGEFTEAIRMWSEAESDYVAIGDDREALTSRLRRLEAESRDPEGDRRDLLRQVQQLRRQAAERGQLEVIADCMTVEVRMLDRLGLSGDVKVVTHQAASRTLHAGAEAQLRFLLVSMVDAVYGDPERVSEVAERAMALARETERPDLALRVANWRIIALYQRGRLNLSEGQAAIVEGLALASRNGDVELRYQMEANIGVWYLDTGDYDAADFALTRAETILGGLGAPHLRRTLLGNRGQLALETGEPAVARRFFQSSLSDVVIAPWGPHQRMALSGIALSHLEEGNVAAAQRIRETIPSRPESWTGDPYLWLALEARLDLLRGASVREVATKLRAEEEGLRWTIATAWMRLRILRFAICLRRKLVPSEEDAEELMSFLNDNELHIRLMEFTKLIARHGLVLGPAWTLP